MERPGVADSSRSFGGGEGGEEQTLLDNDVIISNVRGVWGGGGGGGRVKEKEKEGDHLRERERERERSNSKILLSNDCSLGSFKPD